MKKLFLALLLLSSYLPILAQETTTEVKHQGFYLSMATGPAWGNIRWKANGVENKVKGDAFGFDLQIGGAIQPNLLLHATLQSKAFVGPKLNGIRQSSDYIITESFYGAGLTKYTSQNFFFTGNIGIGNFMQTDTTDNNSNYRTTSTDPGFSFNIRVGKEWMVSRKWGLGGALFYSKTTLNNSSGAYSEHWNSDRFGLYFQATLSKAK